MKILNLGPLILVLFLFGTSCNSPQPLVDSQNPWDLSQLSLNGKPIIYLNDDSVKFGISNSWSNWKSLETHYKDTTLVFQSSGVDGVVALKRYRLRTFVSSVFLNSELTDVAYKGVSLKGMNARSARNRFPLQLPEEYSIPENGNFVFFLYDDHRCIETVLSFDQNRIHQLENHIQCRDFR